MATEQFEWFTSLGGLGQEWLDLSRCRRYVVSDYNPHAYENGLIYYCWTEREIWVRHRITAGPHGVDGRDGVRHIFDQCHPEEVAYEILRHRIYGGRLPKELERYRHPVRADRSQAPLAWSEGRSGEASATRRPRLWWDSEDKTLTFDGVVFKRFERDAGRQFRILDAFQDAHWATSVSFPRSRREELKTSISSMNAWPGSPIKFSQVGLVVRWLLRN
jgi:hypothetical protein